MCRRGAGRTEPSLFVAVLLQRRTHKPNILTLQPGGHQERERDPDTFWIFISFHLSDRYSGLIGILSLCTCLRVLLFVNWTFNSFDLANPPPWLPRAAGTGKLCDLQLSPRTEYVPFQIGQHSLAEMPFFVCYSAICVAFVLWWRMSHPLFYYVVLKVPRSCREKSLLFVKDRNKLVVCGPNAWFANKVIQHRWSDYFHTPVFCGVRSALRVLETYVFINPQEYFRIFMRYEAIFCFWFFCSPIIMNLFYCSKHSFYTQKETFLLRSHAAYVRLIFF